MTKIKLYSPPIITSKCGIKIGHGANLVCTNSMQDINLDKSRIKKILKGTSKLIF